MKNIKLIILSMMTLSALTTSAKDFGTKGHTYKITEQAFLEMKDGRLKKVDVENKRKEMERITKERINNPQAIENVTPAVKNRTFYWDPTYTLDQDAVLPWGAILHKAGTQVNPLEHMVFNRRLFFIDAREKEQVKWLKAKLNNPLLEQIEPIEDKIILVGGSPLKLQEQLGKNIYFDQQGALTTKFSINHSPALVEQDGLMLRIQEFKLKKQWE